MLSSIDILVLATHPDDAEATCGGTIAKLVSLGARVGILDACRGEMGSRGTAEERLVEAAAASKALGVIWRENLELKDGSIVPDISARNAIARRIRQLRPQVMIAPWWQSDLHPDHAAVGALARQAFFVAGLKKLDTTTEPHRPKRVLYYPSHDMFEPQFVVALSDELFQKKIAALRCFSSQLKPSSQTDRGQHFVHGQDLEERITLRARYFGAAAGAKYGEPFRVEGFLSDGAPLGFP